MFKNRAITVSVEKQKETKTPETSVDDKSFEKKVAIMRSSLEGLGAKMFLGVCIYMLLDTHRQVSVAKVMYDTNR